MKKLLIRAVLLSAFATVPLSALIIWAIYGPTTLAPTSAVIVKEGIKEITVRAYAWGFSPSIIYVNPNDTIRFIVVSEDMMHGFAINELKINLQLLPGKQVQSPVVKVNLPEGTYTIHCSIFCGMGHSLMKAKLVVGRPGPSFGSELPWIASLISLAAVAAFAFFARTKPQSKEKL